MLSFAWYTLLLTSCVHRGNYTTAGSFERVQLPLRDARIGVLEPRGPFGDPASADKAYRELRSMLKKCGEAELLTEDMMNEAAQLPALYGEGLAEHNLQFFVEQTDLDYILYLDIGPGRGEMVPSFPAAIPADREASAFVYVYDLTEGALVKTVQVKRPAELTGGAPVVRDRVYREGDRAAGIKKSTAGGSPVQQLYTEVVQCCLLQRQQNAASGCAMCVCSRYILAQLRSTTYLYPRTARMAELVDALDSSSHFVCCPSHNQWKERFLFV